MKHEIEILPAWPGGPLRKFTRTNPNSQPWIYYMAHGWSDNEAARRRYAGAYICSSCRKTTSGVFEPNWVCGHCRKTAR